MTNRRDIDDSHKLIVAYRGAYTMALVIIAAVAVTSYLLLHHMMASNQQNSTVLAMVEQQKTLSQRVSSLAGSIDDAAPFARMTMLAELRRATDEFTHNHLHLVRVLALDADAPEKAARGSPAAIMYLPPHGLDRFARSLGQNGDRLVGAIEQRMRSGDAMQETNNVEAAPVPRLSQATSDAVLRGYSALGHRISADSNTAMERVLALHRFLFVLTIVVICLVAVFIFRPMTDIIRNRTNDLVEARNSMTQLAVRDGLTGLHNRAFMADRFDGILLSASRRNERVAVIQVDLDSFKQINDTLGHAAGDEVLRRTAERIRRSCRSTDICIRLGGDEFVMLMPAAGSSEDIDGLAARILRQLNEPMHIDGATAMVGASAGIAVFPDDAANARELLIHADLALYSAKRQGGGDFAFFSDSLRHELDRRKRLESELKDGIARAQFTVHFQPQVSLSNGRVIGVEALLRWHHPERGVIAPGAFLPVAEKAGLLPRIGRIAMHRAMTRAGDWHRAGIEFGRLAINVSGTELREPDFTEFLFDALRETGLPADRLALEIVESVILDDEKTGVAGKLRMVRAAGIHLELDDFGTGYASLTHVNANEIDRLKIDRRFVQNIDVNDDNGKIVRAITELARSLGIAIVAEGAETQEELTSLMALGCDQVQGYSIAFPMPEAETRDWLLARGQSAPQIVVDNENVA